MGLAFKKAEKKQAKLRLALTGPSGAGKTFSGLLIASGMGKRIAVIDTENRSAAKYAGEPGIPDFDVVEIEPPYTVQKYTEAMKAAIEAGYEVLLIDSISHAWAGEGGLLQKKEALDVRGGNSYTNWAPVTKEHEQFKSALLNCPIHLIVTMRSKQDYVLETNDKGKSAPRKVGLAPIQRDGMEYEFDLVLDVAMDHNASVSKSRLRSFDGRLFTPDKKTGHELLAWLNAGAAPAPTTPLEVHAPEAPKEPPRTNADGKRLITEKQRARLFALLKQHNKAPEELKKFLFDTLGSESTKDIPMDDYEQVCAWVEG
jgi:hypothetical protein